MAEQRRPRSQERPTDGSAPRKKRRKKRRALRRVLTAIGTLFLVFIITCSFMACFAAVYIKNVILPTAAEFDVADYPVNLSSTIYYTDPDTGELLEYESLSGDQDRVWVEFNSLPKNLVNAAVAIEDRRFYQHNGVDWLSTAKGVLKFFTGGKIRGGSTITQQLIKNVTQYDDVTVKRKIVEIFRALDFDKKYSKDQTLEWYLNYVYFGRKCYGVYTAAYTYFGKDVTELDLAECASLISITNNPSLYDPYTHPENNHARRNDVLDAMLRDGYISEAQCAQAKAEEIDFHQSQRTDQVSTHYTWYTEQVITDVINDLMATYGYSETLAKDLVNSRGLNIYACVDVNVQAAVDSVYSNIENLPYISPSGQQLQSAITIIDPQGNVVALAGKLGEKTAADTRGYNMATRALRQSGSSIKPLAVYAPAIEMGLITPYSVYEDSAVLLLENSNNPDADPTLWPYNVDRVYRGQVTIDRAVTNSYNTIAVRVLQDVTPEVSYEYLTQKFGIDSSHVVAQVTINGKEYTDIGLSQLALGGLTRGVSTLDMASAYSVFPRNGVYIEPRTYSRVEDANGKILLENTQTMEPVLKETTVHYINELLQNVVKNGSGRSAAFDGMTIAGKTGTTTSQRDLWFVGYTPYYTAAVWVGYPTTSEMITGTGSGSAATKLWRMVMSQVHEGLEDKALPTGGGLVPMEYCLDTGLLATEECRSDIRGNRTAVGNYFPEDVPADYCTAHVMVEICTADPILDEEGNPTGRYHLAGEFCPAVMVDEEGNETLGRIAISVLDMERQYVGEKPPNDNVYFLTALEEAGPCTVHTEAIPVVPPPYDPSQFNIANPSTWPTPEQDPNFDPYDESTWPNRAGYNPPPVTSESPGGTDTPVFTPPPVPVESEPSGSQSPPTQGPTHTPGPTPTSPPASTPTPSPSPAPTPEPTPEDNAPWFPGM